MAWTKVFAKSFSGGSSLKTCSELGWKPRHGSDDRVCAASHCHGTLAQGQKRDSARPLLVTTYDEARAVCHSDGARLCTLAELEAHETAGAGCGHDGRRIWSSTSCGFSSSFTQFGVSRHGSMQSNCESHRSPSGHVRCCADTSTNADIGAAAFQAAVERSQLKLIKRTCADCASEYQEVIYMRTGVDFHDYYDLFHHAWVRRNNVMHRDFELFSSDEDALAHRNTWGFCNYAPDNRNGIGFPRECGASGKVKFQVRRCSPAAAHPQFLNSLTAVNSRPFLFVD